MHHQIILHLQGEVLIIIIMEQQQTNQIIHLQGVYRQVQRLRTEELNQGQIQEVLNQVVEEIILKEKELTKMEETHQVQVTRLKVEVDRLSHL